MKRWWKRRQRKRRHKKFVKAYLILRKEADIHKAEGHMMDFRAVNESYLIMQCTGCPDFHTQGASRRP